jgi:RHS repeat-associated protein
VRYLDGAVILRQTDISVPGGGYFGHRRSYGNTPGGAHVGMNGYNWWSSEIPYAVAAGASTVAIVFDYTRTYWFDKIGGNYVPRYGFLGVSLVENTTTKQFTFVDTSNAKMQTTVFNSLVASNPGRFISQTDWRGVQTTVASWTSTAIVLQRSFTTGAGTITESLTYTLSGGYLQSVQLQRQVGSGTPTSVEQVVYVYYSGSDPNGVTGDLKSASLQLPDGVGGWNTVATDYYRYWLSTSEKGFAHGLKIHLGPESYRQLLNAGINPDTASDGAVLPYADHYFEYNPTTYAVTREKSAVCPSCPGGGTTSDQFAYTPNPHYPGDGFNTWKMKTTQTLPDSSQIVVYTNYAGQPMIKANVDPTGVNIWATAYVYGSDGRLKWAVQPSAMISLTTLSGLEANNDLLGYSAGLYVFVRNSAGLIETYYYDSNGNLSSRCVRNGQSGSDVQIEALTYGSHSDSSTPANTIYPISTRVLYPSDSSTTPSITTSYTYDLWQTGTNYLLQRTTYLPPVSASTQNGSGATPTIVEVFDDYGNLTSRKDVRDVTNLYTYASSILGAVSEQTLNYVSGGSDPGMNMVSDFTYDNLGRRTRTLGPWHTVALGSATSVRAAAWTVYVQTAQPISGAWGADSMYTEKGYYDGSTYTVVYPVTITNMDKDGRTTDVIESTSGTGSAPVTPSLSQSAWSSWSSTQYDLQHRTISSRVYFSIPTTDGDNGSAGVNYSQTLYGYDLLERRNRVLVSGGPSGASSPPYTITRTVWTTPQWVAGVWVGTDDTGATDADPSGKNAIQFVQAESESGTGTISATPINDVKNGSTLIVYACVYGTGAPASGTISSSPSYTWTQVVGQSGASASAGGAALWMATGVSAGSTTVTFAPGSGVRCTLVVGEYQGVVGSSPVDVSSSASSATGSTAPAAGSLTTTHASDLILGAASQGGGDLVWSPGTGFILRAFQGSATDMAAAVQDRSVTATGSYNAVFSMSASEPWTAIAVALKSAASSGNNMVQVTANVYDGGSAGGDGTLTQQTQYADSGTPRVTSFGYDFRDRRINLTGEESLYEACLIDNLDRIYQIDRRDTNASGTLIGRTIVSYDDRNRVFRRKIYAVDSSGNPGNYLVGNIWYDEGTNIIQQIQPGDGQRFTKNVYNGAGWMTASYVGYNTNGTNWTQANEDPTTAQDTIIEQVLTTYDNVGNQTLQANYERLNDANPNMTGALGYNSLAYGWTVAAFPFNGNANDLSQYRDNGTAGTGVGFGTSGSPPTGTYATFDGTTNAVVTVPNATQLHLTGDLTMAAFVNPADFSNNRCIISKTNSGGPYPAPYDSYLTMTSGIPSFSVGNGTSGGSAGYSGTNSHPASSWSHFAAKVSGTTVTFYKNGVANGTGIIGVTPTDAGTPLYIGKRADNGSIFSGSMTDVRLYNSALSAAEIAQLATPLAPARLSYVAFWYDGIDRQYASADYGALGIPFTPPGTPPSSSDTVLVNSTAYNSGTGRVDSSTDPKGIEKAFTYDNAGRKTKVVEDSAGIARETDLSYTLDNMISTMKAVNPNPPGTGDQTTTWTYGTTLTDSDVAQNDLLVSVTYPDSVSGSDVVTYAYNRLGQVKKVTDQRDVERTIGYDLLGRKTSDAVTHIPSGSSVDTSILRVTWGYDVRGMVNQITSYDAASGGSIKNQIVLWHNDFNQLYREWQAHSGQVYTTGTPSPYVQYDHDLGASSSNEIRLIALHYPDTKVITYNYGPSNGMNDHLNRAENIQDTTSGTTLASYTYLGLRTVVRVAYPSINAWLDLWGGVSGIFNGLDLFGRVIDQNWQDATNTTSPTSIDEYRYGHDRNSNRIWKQNVVASGKALDELYAYDALNRLNDMKRGTLSLGPPPSITGTPTVEQNWTLDQAGNWYNLTTHDSTGSIDLNQTRMSSTVNAITNITESTGPTWIVPGYDAAGNMTHLPQVIYPTLSYDATYDAWNRMMAVSASGTPTTGYKYDGRGRRIVRLGYTSGTLSETRDFYFTRSGQDIEQRVNGSSSMDQQHVWGIRYINELVCRYDAASYLFFVCQDANFNVTALVNASTGNAAERFVYTPYGMYKVLDSSWSSISDTHNWMYLFQGGWRDVATAIYQFGPRDLHPGLGCWVERDPIGYVDAPNLYGALIGNPVRKLDPDGTRSMEQVLRDQKRSQQALAQIKNRRAAQIAFTKAQRNRCCSSVVFATGAFGTDFYHLTLEVKICDEQYRIELERAYSSGDPDAEGKTYEFKPGQPPSPYLEGSGALGSLLGIPSGSSAPSSPKSFSDWAADTFGGNLEQAWGIWVVPHSHLNDTQKDPILDASPLDFRAGESPCTFARCLVDTAKQVAKQAQAKQAKYDPISQSSNSFISEVISKCHGQVSFDQITTNTPGYGTDFSTGTPSAP